MRFDAGSYNLARVKLGLNELRAKPLNDETDHVRDNIMKKNTVKHSMAALALAAGFAAPMQHANAVPTLQLGILGGTYDAASETVFSNGPSFALYAFLIPDTLNPLTDTYYLSMAITPQVATPTNLGSFTYNSTTVNVTSGMTYGTPPIDVFSSSHDAGDLAPHGVFPTYFKEVGFSFSSSNQSGIFNTQDHPSWGPQAGTGMYYQVFSINTTNLADGYEIHFDLYNTKLCTKKKGSCGSSTDTDITQFAPFSHDAQSISTPIPEPEIYAMLGAGLGFLGWANRRRKRELA